jgi:hypothetical protein
MGLALLMMVGCGTVPEVRWRLADVTLVREYAADVDWQPVADDFNGTMFDVVTVSLAGQRVRLVGFEPFVEECLVNAEGGYPGYHILRLLVGQRHTTWLYVVAYEGELYLGEVVSPTGACERPILPSYDELLMAVWHGKGPARVTHVRPEYIYVEPRFFDFLAERGVRLPPHWVRLEDQMIQREAAPAS